MYNAVMDRKKLIKRLTYLILFIFVINFLANKLYWYSSIWWFDMPMHFLGGFWIISLYLFSSQKISIKLIFKILLLVLIVGIGWEIFEVLVNDIVSQNPFNALDTFSDIFFDLSGGAMATLYFFKRIIMPIREDTV